MKKVKIYWTVFAERSLESIENYITIESGSDNLARKYIGKLLARVDQLEFFPESGTKEPLLRDNQPVVRYLVEGNYKIIYQYDGKTVIITDIFHVKQNPVKIKRSIK